MCERAAQVGVSHDTTHSSSKQQHKHMQLVKQLTACVSPSGSLPTSLALTRTTTNTSTTTTHHTIQLQAYARCHKANPNDAAACNNLQTSLVMCYAAGGCVFVLVSLSGLGVGAVGVSCLLVCDRYGQPTIPVCLFNVHTMLLPTSLAKISLFLVSHTLSTLPLNNVSPPLCPATPTDLCKEAAAAHEKCYMSVINTGAFGLLLLLLSLVLREACVTLTSGGAAAA